MNEGILGQRLEEKWGQPEIHQSRRQVRSPGKPLAESKSANLKHSIDYGKFLAEREPRAIRCSERQAQQLAERGDGAIGFLPAAFIYQSSDTVEGVKY